MENDRGLVEIVQSDGTKTTRVPPGNSWIDEGCGFCGEKDGKPVSEMKIRDFTISCFRLGRTFTLEARNWSGSFNLVIDYCPFCGRRLTLPIDGVWKGEKMTDKESLKNN